MQKELWVNIIWSWDFVCLHRLKCFHKYSSMVNGGDMFTFLLSTFHSSANSFPTCLEKSRSGLVKRPFWSSCDAIVLAHTRHLSGLDAVLPVRRLIVCQTGVCVVNGFHCLYPTFLVFLLQVLDQDVSCGFRPHSECCGCVVFIQLLAFFVPVWNVVLLIATGTDCLAALVSMLENTF